MENIVEGIGNCLELIGADFGGPLFYAHIEFFFQKNQTMTTDFIDYIIKNPLSKAAPFITPLLVDFYKQNIVLPPALATLIDTPQHNAVSIGLFSARRLLKKGAAEITTQSKEIINAIKKNQDDESCVINGITCLLEILLYCSSSSSSLTHREQQESRDIVLQYSIKSKNIALHVLQNIDLEFGGLCQ